jgi:NCAIR mutase (PurE)-related protein
MNSARTEVHEMHNSCSTIVTNESIDNGINAAYTAVLIACASNRVS